MSRGIAGTLEALGRYVVFVWEILCSIPKKPSRLGRCLAELERIGVDSVPIILLSSAAIGAIFALQFMTFLEMFQAEIGVGALVSIALGRELAPIITTLMLIAKNGSAMAAELGTMKVTEQIDALESMSVNVVHYLVLPKVIACLLAFPVLTLLANVIGVLGAYVIAAFLFNVDSAGYLDYMFYMTVPMDITLGLVKAVVMGFMTATICCFNGLGTTQGATGVGDSATRAVVISSVSILLAGYVLNTIMLPLLYQ
ncbi:MAG: ABC transporter permease [Treponema sp.]|nr:ABC transporter permease [Treponema sp.]